MTPGGGGAGHRPGHPPPPVQPGGAPAAALHRVQQQQRRWDSCLLATVATSTAVSALLRSARCGAECGQLDLASVPYTALRYVSLDPAPPPPPPPATYTLPPTLHDIAAFYSGDVASHIYQYLLISTNIYQYLLQVINASPVSMGLLSTRGPPVWHPATQNIK